jgi:hypothetical protein
MQARYSFRHGEVHDAEDRMARYVVRLSMALGDLRIAVHYAIRKRQNTAQRLYFVRLVASHARELVLIMDPPNLHVVPPVEEFLRSLPPGTEPAPAEIRQSHARAMALLEQTMAPGRPAITTAKGQTRAPKLRDDIKELRDRFFHYGHDARGDEAIRLAMTALRGDATGYIIRERTLRALYADDVGMTLTHPFPARFAEDMHSRVLGFVEPAVLFVQQVEAAWLHAHRDVVVVRRPGRTPQTLREFIGR